MGKYDGTMGKVQTVQRYVQQTIRDLQSRMHGRRQSDAYARGWVDACDACIEAFNNPNVIEDVLTSARGRSDQLRSSGSDAASGEG